MNFAFTSSEEAKNRTLQLLLGDKSLEAVRMQIEAKEDAARTKTVLDLLFGEATIGGLFGGSGLVGKIFGLPG